MGMRSLGPHRAPHNPDQTNWGLPARLTAAVEEVSGPLNAARDVNPISTSVPLRLDAHYRTIISVSGQLLFRFG
jgi:hypothetical protein